MEVLIVCDGISEAQGGPSPRLGWSGEGFLEEPRLLSSSELDVSG